MYDLGKIGMDIKINPKQKKWEITATVPGDKSIAHRALLISAISSGNSTICNLPASRDIQSTYTCLKRTGVQMRWQCNNNLLIQGRGLRGLKQPESFLPAGNSATTARLLSGILVGQSFNSTIQGDDSLSQRPMRRIIIPLTCMGARIISCNDGDTLPLCIKGTEHLHAIFYRAPLVSAQVKSAFLLASLFTDQASSYHESLLSRDHTEIMLKTRGLNLVRHNDILTIHPGEPQGADMTIPGDFSTAALLIALALSLPAAHVKIKNVGLNPTRTAFLDILRRMGARIYIAETVKQYGESVGDIEVCSSQLQGVSLYKDDIIGALDEIPLLAGVAALAQGRTSIRGAEELAVKESNRLLSTAAELSRWGVPVHIYADGMDIEGGARHAGSEFYSHRDHRIAMLAIFLGANSISSSVIKQAECLSVSIPHFYEYLQQWQLVD